MVFNATFNNISVIFNFIGGENHRPAANHGQTLSHNVVSSTPVLSGIRTDVNGDIRTGDIDSYKLNYQTTTTTEISTIEIG